MPTYDLGITVTGHDKASGVFKPVEDSIRRIFDVASGILLSKVVIGIAEQIGHIAMSSIDATAQLQTMRVSLESLASRELIRASDGMLKLADVEGQAGDMASKMMDQLARMSILSPYTLEAVQNTFRLNTAFGYTFQEATKMTDGLLKMAAGVGADNEQLNRMAYNLAQVRLQGKVMALDVRQLAMAGLDLEDVLKKVAAQYGFQISGHKEFNDLIKEGKISWEQFAEGFSKYADENFGKASEKMARTLNGLKSTFHDVFILTMPRIIGPSVEKVTLVLGGLLDMFIKIRDTDILDKLGAAWSAGLGKVLNPMQTLVDGLNGYIDVWLAAKGFTAKGLEMEEAKRQLDSMEAPLTMIKTFLTQAFGSRMGDIIFNTVGRIINGAKAIKDAFGLLLEGDLTGALERLSVPQGLINFINDIIAAVGNIKKFWDQNKDGIMSVFSELASGILEFAGLKVEDAFEGTGGMFETLTAKLVENGPEIVTALGKIKDFILGQVLPAVDRFINKVINEWIPKAKEFGEYLAKNWQPILQKIIVLVGTFLAVSAGFSVFKTIAAALLPVIGFIGALITQVGMAGGITAFLAGLSAFATMMAPYVAIVLGAIATAFGLVISLAIGFAAAGTLIIKHWQTVQPIFAAFFNTFKENIAPAFGGLLQALTPLRAAVGELMNAFAPLGNLLWAVLKPVLEVIGGVLVFMLINGLAILTGIIMGVVSALTSFATMLTNVITYAGIMVQGVMNIFGGFFNTLIALFTGNEALLEASWQQFTTGLEQLFGGLVGILISLTVGLFSTIMSFFSGFVSGALAVWQGFWTALASVTTGKMQELSGLIANNMQQMIDKIRAMGNLFSSIGKAIVDGIKVGIQQGWSQLMNWFSQQLNAMVNMAQNTLQIWSPARPFIYMGKMITEGLKVGVKKLPDVLKGMVINPLRDLRTTTVTMGGRNEPSNSYTNDSTEYYAPVYNIYNQPSERFSAQSNW